MAGSLDKKATRTSRTLSHRRSKVGRDSRRVIQIRSTQIMPTMFHESLLLMADTKATLMSSGSPGSIQSSRFKVKVVPEASKICTALPSPSHAINSLTFRIRDVSMSDDRKHDKSIWTDFTGDEPRFSHKTPGAVGTGCSGSSALQHQVSQ